MNEADAAISAIRDEALRRIGRNVVLFQELENVLKFLASVQHPSTPMSNAEAARDKRAESIRAKTLGQVAGPVVEELFAASDAQSTVSAEIIEPWLTASFRIAGDPAGQQFDATRLIVYRDGPLLGQGDAWNEIDAFSQLLDDARSRGWILGEPQWAALELAKGAEGMRVFDCAPHPKNPLVGRCVFSFSNPNTALVCSTGHPYLTQGTAAPLKAHLVELAGSTKVEDALRDLVWQCDLGFTKPDMGFSLPWVLRVADAGALQRSRSYKISGIAA